MRRVRVHLGVFVPGDVHHARRVADVEVLDLHAHIDEHMGDGDPVAPRERRVHLTHNQRNFGTAGDLLGVFLFVYVASVMEWADVVSGLVLGLVGIDKLTGQSRLAFGIPNLLDGISVTTLAVGLFAMGEALHVASRFNGVADTVEAVRGSLWMTREEWKRSWKPWLRGIGLNNQLSPLTAQQQLDVAQQNYVEELIKAQSFKKAEQVCKDFYVANTNPVQAWSGVAALEFWFRDNIQ